MSTKTNRRESNASLQKVIDHGEHDYEAATEYLRQKRDEFVEVTEARLETLDHELARLNQQASDAEVDVHRHWHDTWGRLTRQRRAAQRRLHDVSVHSTEAWHDLAQGVDKARQDLAAAIAHARDEFKLSR